MKQTYLVIVVIAILGMAIITVAPLTRRSQANDISLQSTPTGTIEEPTNSNVSAASTPTISTPSTSTAIAPTPQQASSGLKNGTFRGATSSNQFGDVNISIVVSSGKITDVVFNSMPDLDRKSAQISTQVSPILKSQTISAQSANIDGVSGATYTTSSYINSLQAAIDAAKA